MLCFFVSLPLLGLLTPAPEREAAGEETRPVSFPAYCSPFVVFSDLLVSILGTADAHFLKSFKMDLQYLCSGVGLDADFVVCPLAYLALVAMETVGPFTCLVLVAMETVCPLACLALVAMETVCPLACLALVVMETALPVNIPIPDGMLVANGNCLLLTSEGADFGPLHLSTDFKYLKV